MKAQSGNDRFIWLFFITAVLSLMLTSCVGGAGSAPADSGFNSYTVGGTAFGLTGSVVLQNNNGDNLTVPTSGGFTFTSKIASGSTYSVTVLSQQVGQRCSITSGTGTIAAANVTSVAVICITDNTPYTVGGTALGLTGSVVLQNNSGDNLTVPTSGGFTFANKIASGSTYSVTVLSQQVGQRCSITSGTGTIAAANVTSVAVICITDNTPYTIGGTLMGLAAGNSITVANNNANNITLAADGVFAFLGTQLTGSTYSLSIVTLPSNQPCTSTYSAGTVKDANISSLSVICGLLPNGSMAPAANSATARNRHTSTLLLNGNVLVAGGASAELYDPVGDTWSVTGSLTSARGYHTATLLPNGKVLVTGGLGVAGYTASAELYDPATGAWTTTGNLATARGYHTATLLPNGKVLVAGGFNSRLVPSELSSAELYDPATGAWTTTGNLGTERVYHTATMLPNGKLLVAGGMNTIMGLSSAELYNPDSGSWTFATNLNEIRLIHTATLLPNGKVLVSGGKFIAQSNTSELYDPVSDTWMPTGSLATDRDYHTATLLPTGKVLVTGGESAAGWLTSAELYDPASGTWTNTGSLATPRVLHTSTLLPNGKVLIAGGYDISTLSPLTSSELYW